MYSMEFSKNFALEDNSPDTLSSFHVKRYWVICVLVKWRHDVFFSVLCNERYRILVLRLLSALKFPQLEFISDRKTLIAYN